MKADILFITAALSFLFYIACTSVDQPAACTTDTECAQLCHAGDDKCKRNILD